MYVKKLTDYKYGFISGELFDESLVHSSNAVAIQHFNKNQIIAFWYRKTDTEYYVIAKGKVWCDGNVYHDGDILVYEPYDVRKMIFLDDTELTVVRSPGTSNDYFNASDTDDDQLVDFINRLYPKTNIPTVNISYSDISVIVQGPVSDSTQRCTESIRRYLPGAEIILSTWEGSDINGLSCDKMLLLKDPGGIATEYKGKRYVDNTNRQLVSIQEGLAVATKKYCLKIRSDSILLNNSIVAFWNEFDKRVEGIPHLFDKRIVIGESFNVLSRSFDGITISLPFMVSDWFYFGYTDDLRKLFEKTPLLTKKEAVDYKYKNDLSFHRYMRWNKIFHHRYCAEQYYLINALRNIMDVPYDDMSDANEENISLSNKIILDNFAVLNPRQHMIVNLKKIEDSLEGVNCFKYEKRYGNEAFLRDYAML